MGRRWAGGGRVGQGGLLAVDVRDQLPADHLVWAVLEVVADLDLSQFEALYRGDGSGRPPYDPQAMVALIVYCGLKKQVTSQEIADACRDDLGARVIMGNAYPHRGTITRFREHHDEALQDLLPQTVRLGDAAGLVDLSLVAGDGTKVVANAAMRANTSEEALRGQIADLERRVEAAEQVWAALIAAPAGPFLAGPDLFTEAAAEAGLFTEAIVEDAAEAGLFTEAIVEDAAAVLAGPAADAGRPGEGPVARAWRRLGQLTRLLARRRAALAWLAEHPPAAALVEWQERMDRDTARVAACTQRLEALRARLQAEYDARVAAEAAGEVFRGPPRVHPDQHTTVGRRQAGLAKAQARAEATAAARPAATRVNTTDPSSRVMPGKHDGFDQRFNFQALTCRGPFVLAVDLHDSPNDKQALQPLIRKGRGNLDRAGIHRPIQVAALDSGYASEDNFTADLPVGLLLVAVEAEARQTGRRRDEVSTAAAAWQQMADTLADPANAALYKRRAATVEPLFAQLFARFGRAVHTRGDQAVLTELHVWAVIHNLGKIIRCRRARSKPVAAA